VRPELGALSIGLLALKAWPLWRAGRRRAIATMAGFAAAAAAPWVLWALIATGSPLPSTAGAKIYFFAERHLPRSMKGDRVIDAVRDFGSNLGVVVLAGLALVRLPVGRVILGFALVLVAFYYRELPGALNHYEHRYLYVLVPGLLLGFAWAFGRSRVASAIALVLAIVALGQVASNWDDRWGYYLATREFTRVDLGATADWVNENVPPGSKLLLHDAGYVAANTDFELVDMVGLKTPRAVRFHEDLTFGSVGVLRGEAAHRIALQEQPDYLIALAGWNWTYRITDSLRAHGWEVKPVSRSAYTIYSLEPPPPGWRPPPPPPPPRPGAPAPPPGA
jgi:hypothetical protein